MAVEWRTFSASYVESPGGEAKQIRSTTPAVVFPSFEPAGRLSHVSLGESNT
jgi:hypothetical protein